MKKFLLVELPAVFLIMLAAGFPGLFSWSFWLVVFGVGILMAARDN
jgi:hypothetical protein